MITENLHQPFEISLFEVDEWKKPPHKHTYFELVYIQEGTGRQCINKEYFDYHKGHLFLLIPEDCHSFQVETPTKFVFIRFTNVYFSDLNSNQEKQEYTAWLRKLEYIFANYSRIPGCIMRNESDMFFCKALLDGIVKEYINKGPFHSMIIRQTLSALLNIVARNIVQCGMEKIQDTSENGTIFQIMGHIQQNIYDPQALRAEAIANRFFISVNYLGQYFKKHTGETLQQYITTYKMKLVETRLQHSDMRVIEIADELSFTDESHLTKMFKKFKGVSPKAYRQQLKTGMPA